MTSNNSSSDNADVSPIGPTRRFKDEAHKTEVILIDLDSCLFKMVFDKDSGSSGPDSIGIGHVGSLVTEDDLRAALYQVYSAIYDARAEMGSQLTSADVRAKLFQPLADDSPITQDYDVAWKLSQAAIRGIDDATIALPARSQAEICYRLLNDESHLDVNHTNTA